MVLIGSYLGEEMLTDFSYSIIVVIAATLWAIWNAVL